MADPTPPPKPRRLRRFLLRSLLGVMLIVLLLLGLFLLDGLVLASRENVVVYPSVPLTVGMQEDTITIASLNIAKGFAPITDTKYDTPERVRQRLDNMAEVLRRENPDIVVLSEVMTECTLCPVNQLEHLQKALAMPHAAFGENYHLGLPFLHVVGGNAILSKLPLLPVANFNLIGRKWFFQTSNSRRALFASVELYGTPVLVGSLHNDSYDTRNNTRQVEQLLDFIGDRPCILAGDFNALPKQAPIQLIQSSGRFTGEFDGPATFPANDPVKRIDYIFAPPSWTHLETRVLPGEASDHRAVVARFRVK
jgi:endonuclease/exonuclease/phosphatase family metal-dependent hydrolase